MPVLGICGGQQLLNVALGGTLIQHIPDEVPDALAHEQPNPRNEPGHTVRIVAGTLLHRITGADELAVNSAHHQAVKDAGPGPRHRRRAPRTASSKASRTRAGASASACSGIRNSSISDGDRRIFRAFIAAARRVSDVDATSAPAKGGAHRQGAGARRAVLAPRRRALDRRGPGLGRRRGADQPGASTSTAASDIRVDGKPLPEPERARLWRYHKPAGLVTTHRDEKGRPTVFAASAQGPAAAHLGRPARSQFRGAAAADQ